MILTLTAGYPFGGEPFLISEDQYAPKDMTYLALHPLENNNQSSHEGVRIAKKRNVPIMIWYALCGLFDPLIWQEIGRMRKIGKFSLRNLGFMMGYYAYAVRCYHEVYRWMQKNNALQADTVLYSYWMVTQAMICALLKRKVPGMRMVTRCHGYDIYEYRAPGDYLPFRDFIFRQADAICPISDDGVRYLKETYPTLEAEKIHLHRLGTMDRGLTPPAQNGEPFRIVSCSALISLKRVHLLIKALAKLQHSVEWVHFGSGPLEETLQKQANEELGETPVQFHFFGQVPNQAILSYYHEHHVDLFVNVSETEGVPLSIMEALSFGIPVIATQVGGTAEIIDVGENGFLLPASFAPQELTKKIEEMVAMPSERYEEMSRQARLHWEQKCSAKKNFTAFYDMIRALPSTR